MTVTDRLKKLEQRRVIAQEKNLLVIWRVDEKTGTCYDSQGNAYTAKELEGMTDRNILIVRFTK